MDPLEKAEMFNKRGNNQYQVGQYLTAIMHYTSAISLIPQIAKYHSNRAACHMKQGDYYSALTDAKQSVHLDNGYIKGHMRVAQCYTALGNINGAMEASRIAKGINKEDDKVYMLSKSVNLLKFYYDSYLDHLAMKNYKEALETLVKCHKVCKEDIVDSNHYYYIQAKMYFMLDEYDKAREIAQAKLENNRHDEDALFIKCASRFYQKDVMESIEILKSLKRTLPDHLETMDLYNRAKKMHTMITWALDSSRKDQTKNEYTYLKTASVADPKNKVSNKNLSRKIILNLYKMNWTKEEIILNCSEFMLHFDREAEILKIRAKCNANLAEYEDALEDCEEALKKGADKELQELRKEMILKLKEQNNDCYKMLKVKRDQSFEDIKKTYSALIRECHPDKHMNEPEEHKRRLERKTSKIITAFKKIEQTRR